MGDQGAAVKLLTPDNIEPLVRNFEDPRPGIRIASLRAGARLAGMSHEVAPEAHNMLVQGVRLGLRNHREADILGKAYLPEPEVQRDIEDLLRHPGAIDLNGAQAVYREAARRIQLDPAAAVAHAPYSEPVPSIEGLQQAVVPHTSKQDLPHLISSLYSRLASPAYDADPRSDSRLADAEQLSSLVAALGPGFRPDIGALFRLYRSFLPSSVPFWLNWLLLMRNQEGLDLRTTMPSWFPMYEGGLAVQRQLEWVLSRPGVATLLRGLRTGLISSDPLTRFGAAQLIEGAARYLRDRDYPRFGGGSGPEDVVPPSFADPAMEKTRKYAPAAGTDLSFGIEVEEEARRFTDVTLFSGHWFHGDTPTGRVPDTQAAVEGNKYTLEVAIRRQRTGIDAQREPGRNTRNPRQDTETLKIYILAEAHDPFIVIPEPFDSVEWPYDQDSDSALFRFNVDLLPAARASSYIDLRVYDESLDLLDQVRLTIVAVRPGADPQLDAAEPRLAWPELTGNDFVVPAERPARILSIDIGMRPAAGTYAITFKFLTGNSDQPVAIPGSSRITPGDVENLLVDVRDFWTELVITNYSTKISVSTPTYRKYLESLRELGIRAWLLLFGDRFAARKGASETLGELLAAMHPKEGEVIQITYSGLEDFVFPWSIVHPPTESEQVDPFEFWGARYQIEQVIEGPKDDSLNAEPVSVSFALDPNFQNSQEQVDLLKRYVSDANGKLVVSDPASQAPELFSQLGGNPPAHLYYFYCHGYAPAGKGLTHRDGIQLLRKRIEAIPEGTPEREALETLLSLTAKMNDEPWIYIGGAEIKESRFKTRRFFQPPRRPVVFLNMCQSADLVPSQSGGLVRLFLDHNAAAVIGTESPMTGIFANVFAKQVLNELFSHGTIGTALYKARRHFLGPEQRNPLGLAYTLYGRAVARLGSGALLTKPAAAATPAG